MIVPQEPPRWTRMRFVRCDKCGAKALVACSKCPQCEHPLGLRDSFGEPVPLAYCVPCDVYFNRKYAHCPWCGTKQPTVRKGRIAWTAAAVTVGIGMAWAIWEANTTRVEDPPGGTSVAAAPESTIVIPPERDSAPFTAQPSVVGSAAGSVATDTLAGTSDASLAAITENPTSTVPKPPAPGLLAGPVIPETPPPVISTAATPTPESKAPGAPVVSEPAIAPVTESRTPPKERPVRIARAPSPAPKAKAPMANRPAPVIASAHGPEKSPAAASRPARIRWTPTTVRGWVTVRASADKRSRAIASLGPDTRVQLGEWRGAWVRIRSRGITGWVDGSHPWNIGIASTSGARGLTR